MAMERVVEEISKRGPDKEQNALDKQDDKTTADNVDFDDLLSAAGKFGKYQLLIFISLFPFYVFGVFAYFQQLFLTETSPNHWCWIPELENMTDMERRNLAIPSDTSSRFGYSHCQSYDANWTEVLATGRKPDRTSKTMPCQHGWEFNKTEIPYPTISSELEWVCERDSYQATAQSIFFVGCIVGGFIIGWVSDRYGRIPALVLSNIIGCIGGVSSIYARNFVEFAIYRFFMGMGYDNCMIMAYLLALEYVAPKYRSIMGNVSFSVFYSMSVVVLPWICRACGHWKTIALVTSMPLALALFTPIFLPESPRWMLSKGRVDDAVNRVLTIGRINKKQIPPKLIEHFKTSLKSKKHEESKSVIELMRRPILRKAFVLVCVNYVCCALVFDALVRSIGSLDFDFFISFSVISMTEMPSMFLLAFVMDWLGRRWLCTLTYTICAIFSVLSVFVGGGLPSVMCAAVARFMMNMAYGCITQWAVELLPTPVRGSGTGIVHVCGYIGALISPLIVYLDTIAYWLPLVIAGSISLIGGIISIELPETSGKDMPQTFDDAEEMCRNQRFWDFPCAKKKTEDDDPSGKVNDCFEM